MSTKTKILIFVGLITIAMVVQHFLPDRHNHIIRMEPTGHGVSYNFDASPSFHSNNSRFYYFVTRDGIQYRPSDGDVRWNHSFSFNQPHMVARGDIVAVGERSGGRRVYVFNSTDELLFRAEFEYPVMMFSVNAAGFLSVVLEMPFGYRIYVHNQLSIRAGEYFYRQNIVDDLHFPVAVEVSEDGRYIAVAIVDLSVRVDTTVQLRYTSLWDAVAWGAAEGLFASEIFTDQIVHSLRFMADDRLVVATDSQILGYRIIERDYNVTAKEWAWTVNLQNELSEMAFYGNRHLVYVTGNRHLGAINGYPVGTVHIVNTTDGTRAGEFSTGRHATHLSVGNGAVLVGSDRNFHAIDLRGNHLWEHNSLHYTRSMIFLDDTDTVLIAGANRAEVNRRQRVRVTDFEGIFD